MPTPVSEHEFELKVVSALLDDLTTLDRLAEAGFDDSTLTGQDGLFRVICARRGPSAVETVVQAIRAVEGVPGLVVERVEPDELVWASDIAKRTDRSRESVRLLIEGRRGPGGFPEPVVREPTALWRWSEVEEWFARYLGHPLTYADLGRAIAAVNHVLEARRQAGGKERQQLAAVLV